MKKYLKVLFISTLFLAILGCNKKERSSINKVTIDIDKETLFNIYDDYEPVKYIPLDDTLKGIISNIHRLYVTNDHVLIFDIEEMKIILFSSKGDFVRQIGTKGHAKNEYAFLNDISYDVDSGLIYAYDRYKSKMLIYNLNGDIVDVKPTKFAFNSFIKCDNGYWLYSCFDKNNSNKYNLIQVDNELTTLIKGAFSSETFAYVTFDPTFTKDNNDNIYFHYPLSPSIYKLGEEIQEIYSPDYLDRNLPFDLLAQATNHQAVEKIKSEDFYIDYPQNVVCHDDKFWIRCKESPMGIPVRTYTVNYDPDSNTANIFGSCKLIPDKPNINIYNLKGLSSNNEMIFSIIPSNLSKKERETLSLEIGINVSSSSNLVLALFKRKNK